MKSDIYSTLVLQLIYRDNMTNNIPENGKELENLMEWYKRTCVQKYGVVRGNGPMRTFIIDDFDTDFYRLYINDIDENRKKELWSLMTKIFELYGDDYIEFMYERQQNILRKELSFIENRKKRLTKAVADADATTVDKSTDKNISIIEGLLTSIDNNRKIEVMEMGPSEKKRKLSSSSIVSVSESSCYDTEEEEIIKSFTIEEEEKDKKDVPLYTCNNTGCRFTKGTLFSGRGALKTHSTQKCKGTRITGDKFDELYPEQKRKKYKKTKTNTTNNK